MARRAEPGERPGSGPEDRITEDHGTSAGGGPAARARAGGAEGSPASSPPFAPQRSHALCVKVLYGPAFRGRDRRRIESGMPALACTVCILAPCSYTSTLHPPFSCIPPPPSSRRRGLSSRPWPGARRSPCGRGAARPAPARPACTPPSKPPICGPRRPYHLSRQHRGKGSRGTRIRRAEGSETGLRGSGGPGPRSPPIPCGESPAGAPHGWGRALPILVMY